MPGYGRRSRHRRRDPSDADVTQRQWRGRVQLVAWAVAIGLVSLAALTVAFIFWLHPQLTGKRDPEKLAQAATQPGGLFKIKSLSPDEATVLVKKALGLRNAGEVEAMIRIGPMSAQEVVDYLKAMKSVDGEIKHFDWLGSIGKNGLSLEWVQVSFGGGDKPHSRLAVLTPDAKGVWKLDFAAFARWVKPSWKDLIEQNGESAVVRVNAVKDTYFNGSFRDERIWAAYKLESPDAEEILVGYCKRDSAQQRAMESLWRLGEGAVTRVTLEIRRPQNAAGAERSLFEITRVLAEDWVMGDKPLDEGM